MSVREDIDNAIKKVKPFLIESLHIHIAQWLWCSLFPLSLYICHIYFIPYLIISIVFIVLLYVVLLRNNSVYLWNPNPFWERERYDMRIDGICHKVTLIYCYAIELKIAVVIRNQCWPHCLFCESIKLIQPIPNKCKHSKLRWWYRFYPSTYSYIPTFSGIVYKSRDPLSKRH